MNRLGLSTKEEIDEVYNLLKDKVEIEGVYSHIYDAASKENTNKQFDKFKHLVSEEILKSVKIVHIGASETITGYEKPSFVNGCRLGIIMYGFEVMPKEDTSLKGKLRKLYKKITNQ